MTDRVRNATDDRISVEIRIDGPVINSTVVGVDQRSVRTRSPLFGRVLSEYLLLPTLRDLAHRAQRGLGTAGRSLRTFDFSRHGLEYLWMSLLQDQYWMARPAGFTIIGGSRSWAEQHGAHVAREGGCPDPIVEDQWLMLRNAQLTPFVNRSPGRFYRGGWGFSGGHSGRDDAGFLVSALMWTWEDYAVRSMGIGDVRLPPLDGFRLLQATAATGNDHGNAGVMGPTSTDGRHYAGGAAISALGFPVLVSEELYQRLARLVASHGAVAVDRLTVRLVRAPDDARLLWAPGVPKTVLVAADAASASGIAEPTPAYNAVWTVAADAALTRAHYCTWGFQTGVRDYRAGLEAAAKIVAGAIRERGLRACFEFDHEVNWFSEPALFGPADLTGLAARLPASSPVREAAERVSYAAQFDTLVERECNLPAEQRTAVCLVLADLDEGRVEHARSIFESLDDDVRALPFVRDLEARTAWLAGDHPEAVRLWRVALESNPDYQLRERINRILQTVAEEP